uniref:Uncharacterized protein n=1 Tax=Neisseria meningitidis alpha275 TaxID=295996 RepID=C6SN54_NEIME|nr:hypothetical protein predicted by Glimmer/Critica [Neisseria meningitidis alpha275]
MYEYRFGIQDIGFPALGRAQGLGLASAVNFPFQTASALTFR